MIHEAFGLEEVMQRQAKRLAAAGFLTLAVDLYSAGGAKRCLVPTMTSMLRGHGKAFTDEVRSAWTRLYGVVAVTMKMGASASRVDINLGRIA